MPEEDGAQTYSQSVRYDDCRDDFTRGEQRRGWIRHTIRDALTRVAATRLQVAAARVRAEEEAERMVGVLSTGWLTCGQQR